MPSYLLQKGKTLVSAICHPYYAHIKLATKGYLSPTTYYKIAKYAENSPAGHAIDIGPAQGGTSIAIANGFKKAKKNSEWFVYSIEKGHSSNALTSRSDNSLNENILETNISRFGFEKRCKVVLEYSHEAFTVGDEPKPIGIMMLDADGALDRDFNIFYNNLVADSVIIIDDYIDIINKHGRKRLAFTDEELELFVKDSNKGTLEKTNPLGKEYAIYRFVNYLEDEGLLEKVELSTQTLFCKKPKHNPTFTRDHYDAMQNIRKKIVQDFLQMREAQRA